MNVSFPKRIVLLRKERGLSQKSVAEDLGISQALLSHYEKGIRECGLDFLCKIADYYQVSVDYLLGRTRAKRSSHTAAVPDPSSMSAYQRLSESLLLLYDYLDTCKNKSLADQLFQFLQLAVYRAARILAAETDSLFGLPAPIASAAADAAMTCMEANLTCLAARLPARGHLPDNESILQRQYPQSAESLLALIQTCEQTIRTVPALQVGLSQI